jgi:hypothetical protein
MSYGDLSLAHLAAGGHNRIMTEFDPTVALVEYAKHSTWAFLVRRSRAHPARTRQHYRSRSDWFAR